MLSNEWAQKDISTIMADLMVGDQVTSSISNGEGLTIEFTDSSMLYIPYEAGQKNEEIERFIFPKIS